MVKYRFEQIAINSTEKKKPVEEDRFTYLGLEHLDSGSLKVTRFGSEVAPIGEKLVMHKGDVLFGKRRAYQKKVAIAPFDGIFSAHGMVLRPREDVIDKSFFPLFISSDYFLDAAIKISVGSLSPTINWRDLKTLEFELPDLATQRKLAETLWSINDTMETYKKLIAATDELVKSQFMEQFGMRDCIPEGWQKMNIGEACTLVNGRAFKPSDWTKTGTPIVRIQNLNDPNAEFNYCSGDVEDKFWIDTGTLLFAWSGTPGTSFGAFIWAGGKAVLNQHIFQVYPCAEISKQFLKCSFEGHMDEIIERAHGGVGLRHITKQELERIELLVPPMAVQDDFVAFAQQSDKSKFAVQSCSNLNLWSSSVMPQPIQRDYRLP